MVDTLTATSFNTVCTKDLVCLNAAAHVAFLENARGLSECTALGHAWPAHNFFSCALRKEKAPCRVPLKLTSMLSAFTHWPPVLPEAMHSFALVQGCGSQDSRKFTRWDAMVCSSPGRYLCPQQLTYKTVLKCTATKSCHFLQQLKFCIM